MRVSSGVFLLLMVTLAFALRAAWVLVTGTQIAPFTDSQYYDAVARNLVAGRGYVVDMNFDTGWVTGGQATAFFPPGYSYFLAGVYVVAGQANEAAKWANAILGALTILPCFFIASRLVDARTARVSAALAALLPPFVIPTPVVLSEPLFCLLLLTAIAFALTKQPWGLAVAALVLGMAVLVRPMAFLAIPVFGLWWLWTGMSLKHAGRRMAVMTFICLTVVSPWFVRNVVVLDRPIMVSTNFGYNLRVGHAPYSNGTHVSPPDLWGDRRPTFQEQELEVFQSRGLREGIEYAAGHPLRELTLSMQKVLMQWLPDTDAVGWASTWKLETELPMSAGGLMAIQFLVHLGLLVLVARGCLARGLRPETKLLLVFASVWTLGHVVFFGMPRFNMPVVYVLLPMAAPALPLASRRIGSLRPLSQRHGTAAGLPDVAPTDVPVVA